MFQRHLGSLRNCQNHGFKGIKRVERFAIFKSYFRKTSKRFTQIYLLNNKTKKFIKSSFFSFLLYVSISFLSCQCSNPVLSSLCSNLFIFLSVLCAPSYLCNPFPFISNCPFPFLFCFILIPFL